MCDPRIQFKDGIVPLEEDEHERDASPLTSCEAPDGEISHLPPGHPIVMVLVSPTTSTGGGSAGWRIKRTAEGVLDILLLLGGDHWHGSHGTGSHCWCLLLPSLQLHLIASDAVRSCTSIVGSLVGENVVVYHACLMNIFVTL